MNQILQVGGVFSERSQNLNGAEQENKDEGDGNSSSSDDPEPRHPARQHPHL